MNLFAATQIYNDSHLQVPNNTRRRPATWLFRKEKVRGIGGKASILIRRSSGGIAKQSESTGGGGSGTRLRMAAIAEIRKIRES